MKKFALFAGIVGFFALGIMTAGVALAQMGTGGTAAAGQAIVIDISDTALAVIPPHPNLGVNTPFSLTVRNSGTVNYSLVLENQGAVYQPINGGKAQIDSIAPGASVAGTWTIRAAGIYQLAAYTTTNSTTPSGLTTSLVVSESAAAPGATGTVAGTVEATTAATSAVTETAATTPTPAATTAAAAAGATSTASATGTVASTAEATLPQTGGTDDSPPLGLVLITFGALFVVGGLLAGRRLVRR